MKQKNYIVEPTDTREDVNGDFIAQIHPDEIFLSPLTRFIIIKNTIEDEVFKIPVLLQTSTKVKPGKIRIDQKIRTAIGTGVDKEVEVEFPGWFALFGKVKFLSKIFGKQVNILRVKYATFTDMEIKLCRISDYVMKTIGVEEGDKIIVESSDARISITAFNLPGSMIDERIKKEQKPDSIYGKQTDDKKRRDLLQNIRKTDLPWIFLDNDARKKLEIKTNDPVRVYRDIKYTVRKKIHIISIPLILTVIGFVLGLNCISTDMTKIIIYSVALLVVFYLNLLTIRINVK